MNTDKCATIQIDWTPDTDNIMGFLIDRWVEDMFSECSICVYYETAGDVGQRLESALRNQIIYDAVDVAVQSMAETVDGTDNEDE